MSVASWPLPDCEQTSGIDVLDFFLVLLCPCNALNFWLFNASYISVLLFHLTVMLFLALLQVLFIWTTYIFAQVHAHAVNTQPKVSLSGRNMPLSFLNPKWNMSWKHPGWSLNDVRLECLAKNKLTYQVWLSKGIRFDQHQMKRKLPC